MSVNHLELSFHSFFFHRFIYFSLSYLAFFFLKCAAVASTKCLTEATHERETLFLAHGLRGDDASRWRRRSGGTARWCRNKGQLVKLYQGAEKTPSETRSRHYLLPATTFLHFPKVPQSPSATVPARVHVLKHMSIEGNISHANCSYFQP